MCYWVHMCIQTYMHAHTQTQTHKHTHVYTHTQMHTHAYTTTYISYIICIRYIHSFFIYSKNKKISKMLIKAYIETTKKHKIIHVRHNTEKQKRKISIFQASTHLYIF